MKYKVNYLTTVIVDAKDECDAMDEADEVMIEEFGLGQHQLRKFGIDIEKEDEHTTKK